jgi:FtsZ-binding cell division protein ZapB
VIVNETIAAKEQEMFQTLTKIKEKNETLKKEKERLEEEQRSAARAREDFEREMDEKNR